MFSYIFVNNYLNQEVHENYELHVQIAKYFIDIEIKLMIIFKKDI